MNVKISKESKTTIVQIEGRIDANAANTLANKLTSVIGGSGNQLILDFSGVNFIGSSGIGKISIAAKQAKSANVKMALCSIPSQFRSLFDNISLIPIFANYRDALKSF